MWTRHLNSGIEMENFVMQHRTHICNIVHRHNLGCFDGNVSNYDRVLNHFMIAVGSSGYNGPLKTIQEMMCNATAKRYCRRR